MSEGHYQIKLNRQIHERVAESYDSQHPEIFNDREQARLRESLTKVRSAIRSGNSAIRAFDMGCGTGNLCRHLLALGFKVTATDVTPKFLELVGQRFAGEPLRTSQLNGSDLRQFDDASFGLVATYSVLHHIPDYLVAVAEMGRVCAVGGVVYIDHEADATIYGNSEYANYQREVMRLDWRKYLKPRNYYGKIRRLFDPHFANEGDIHVWPDDHIEWDKIVATLGASFEVVMDKKYLLFNGNYRPEVYERYQGRLIDMRVMAFRRVSASQHNEISVESIR
jgi:ubiquinone/menaquinone biosynthesis C-methylase UbiE